MIFYLIIGSGQPSRPHSKSRKILALLFLIQRRSELFLLVARLYNPGLLRNVADPGKDFPQHPTCASPSQSL
jgi:hypothetical protein